MKKINQKNEDPTQIAPWKAYAKVTFESVASFYIASFCMAVFFVRQGSDSILLSIFMVALYLFIVGATVRRIVQKFAIAALMLIVPIAPLLVLIIFVTMIPILERFQLH
jgi:hypothetical protein